VPAKQPPSRHCPSKQRSAFCDEPDQGHRASHRECSSVSLRDHCRTRTRTRTSAPEGCRRKGTASTKCRVGHVRRVTRGTARHASPGAFWKRPHPMRSGPEAVTPKGRTKMRIRNPQNRRLALLDLFAGCTADQINMIDRLSTEIALPVGTPVWHEDRTEPQFVIVLEGRIELTRGGEHVAALTNATWFGHAALLARLPVEQVSGVVVSPTRLLAFSKREFVSLLHAAPTVAAILEAVETRPTSVATNQSNPSAPTTTLRTRSSRRSRRQNGDREPIAALTQGATRRTTRSSSTSNENHGPIAPRGTSVASPALSSPSC
jgi:CRP-like cAMP-binding protein